MLTQADFLVLEEFMPRYSNFSTQGGYDFKEWCVRRSTFEL